MANKTVLSAVVYLLFVVLLASCSNGNAMTITTDQHDNMAVSRAKYTFEFDNEDFLVNINVELRYSNANAAVEAAEHFSNEKSVKVDDKKVTYDKESIADYQRFTKNELKVMFESLGYIIK
ncbi:MAG: hypothetical protein FWG10_08550 [Eubacteriaceae bacterium]|nr:hypothetical protein [Eubacteriaceae bacterium]